MVELKPCPFCGAKASICETWRYYKFKIVAKHNPICVFDNLQWVIFYETEEDAINAWNRRTEK